MTLQNFTVLTIVMYYTKQMKHSLDKHFYSQYENNEEYTKEKKKIKVVSWVFFCVLFVAHALMMVSEILEVYI